MLHALASSQDVPNPSPSPLSNFFFDRILLGQLKHILDILKVLSVKQKQSNTRLTRLNFPIDVCMWVVSRLVLGSHVTGCTCDLPLLSRSKTAFTFSPQKDVPSNHDFYNILPHSPKLDVLYEKMSLIWAFTLSSQVGLAKMWSQSPLLLSLDKTLPSMSSSL